MRPLPDPSHYRFGLGHRSVASRALVHTLGIPVLSPDGTKHGPVWGVCLNQSAGSEPGPLPPLGGCHSINQNRAMGVPPTASPVWSDGRERNFPPATSLPAVRATRKTKSCSPLPSRQAARSSPQNLVTGIFPREPSRRRHALDLSEWAHWDEKAARFAGFGPSGWASPTRSGGEPMGNMTRLLVAVGPMHRSDRVLWKRQIMSDDAGSRASGRKLRLLGKRA